MAKAKSVSRKCHQLTTSTREGYSSLNHSRLSNPSCENLLARLHSSLLPPPFADAFCSIFCNNILSFVIIFCLFAFTLQSLLDSHSHLPVPETPVPLTSSVSPGLLSLAVMCLSFLRVSELSLSSHHPLPQATYVYDCNFSAVNWKPLQRPCPVWNLGLF